MSNYQSTYISEEELKEQEKYEGDEDEYIDESINFPQSRRCNYTTHTLITGSSISLKKTEDKYNENVIMLVRKNNDETYVIDCFIYSEFKNFITNSNPVFLWEGGDLGHTLENFPVLMIPIKDPSHNEVWFDGNYGMLSRYSCFFLYEPSQKKIGSSYTESARHGSLEYVWAVRPISKKLFLDEGIISENESIFSDNLDFSPGNYPSYNVKVSISEDENGSYCEEKEELISPQIPFVVNIFFRNGNSAIVLQANNISRYIVRLYVSYEKIIFEDKTFNYTGKKHILIDPPNVLVKYNDSKLEAEEINDTDISITYTRDGVRIWKEIIKSDGIYDNEEDENEDINEEDENEDINEEDENEDINEEDEEEEIIESDEIKLQKMNIELQNEKNILLHTDRVYADVVKIIGDQDYRNILNTNIELFTTVLLYNITYKENFELPSPDKVPNLTKLCLYIFPHEGDRPFSESKIIIPYYSNLTYVSVYICDKFEGVVIFTPPPKEDMEYTPLKIVYLNGVKIDENNDKGLPLGLNVERIFLYNIKSTLPDRYSLLKDPNIIIEGDENPEILYGTYPNLKFISLNCDIDIPNYQHLCSLYWGGKKSMKPVLTMPFTGKFLGVPDNDSKSFVFEVCKDDVDDSIGDSDSDVDEYYEQQRSRNN